MAGLFPPQDREWSLPAETPLTPQAAARLGREAATQQGFEPAARALNIDWQLDQPLHPEQVRRWSEELGRSVVAKRDAEVEQYQRGQRPVSPPNEVPLLVIGMDGGRYQSREKDPETGSRWREEKVLTVSSCLPGDGKDPAEGGRAPQKLVTTHVATAQSAKAFGPLARVEAERRGLRQALEVIALGDGGNWIDPLLTAYFHVLARIIDWFHASEHLWDCAKAVYGAGTTEAAQWAERLEALLWDGKVKRVIQELSAQAQKLSSPHRIRSARKPASGAGEQRRVLHDARRAHELPGVPSPRLADRLGRDRGGGEAVQQANQRHRAVLVDRRRRGDPGPARAAAEPRRPLVTLLGKPPRICQLRGALAVAHPRPPRRRSNCADSALPLSMNFLFSTGLNQPRYYRTWRGPEGD